MVLPAENGSGQTISYPLELLTESAQQLRTTAQNALSSHERSWQAIQSYVDSFPAFFQPHLNALLNAYQQRLRSTYKTYSSLADWLDYAHTQMQHADTTIGESFADFLKNSAE